MTVIGTLIGDRYRLDEKVGSGGMSSVYRAFDPTLERWVAIKMMHRDISTDPDQLERFRREARAVAQLNHPHVVTVIDAGEDDGTPVHRARVRGGRDAQGPDPARRAPARLRGGRVRDRDRPRARVRPCARARAPRREAPERADRPGRPRQGHRLRDLAIARVPGPDRHRPRARHHRLRLARAGARLRGDRAVGHLLARHRALRDAHGRGRRSRPTPRSRWP